MWKAEFVDNSVFREKENEVERPFSDVLKRLEVLKTLSVVNSNGDEYSICIQNGEFTVVRDGISFKMFGLDPETYIKAENVRPIYFIRDRIDFTLGGGTQTGVATEQYCALGFQALLDGSTIMRYLKIFPDRSLIICTE